jgi:AcrR family transcriptional regulator
MSTKPNRTPIPGSARRRRLRSDATANRERILDAATVAVRRHGEGVPMAAIAAEATVGIGTLYRHFPTRAALLTALTMRSFSLVLEHAQEAARSSDPAPVVIARFFEQTIAARDRFILPFHGGPDIPSDEILAVRTEIRSLLGHVLERGRKEHTVRSDLTATDIIITGAMLAQPLPNARSCQA